METLYRKYNETVYAGTPELRERFWFSSEVPLLCTLTIYLLFITVIGPEMMKNRKPFHLRSIMFVYNFFLVLIYFIHLLRTPSFLRAAGKHFYCRFYHEEEIAVIFKQGNYILWRLFNLKILELLDTVFMILTKKNKNVTKMHVLHHCLVPIFGWFIARAETGSYVLILLMVNSAVHVIMYTYYGIAALGPKYQKYIWWKKYVTSLQIFQFIFMTVFFSAAYYMGCTTSDFNFLFCFIITVLFLYLFIDYYLSAFFPKKKAVNGNLKDATSGSVYNKEVVNKNK